MKYQLQPQHAILNSNGIATTPGWALIYNVDSTTGEYKNASYEYLSVGVSLPAHAFIDAPKQTDDDHAIVRTTNGWAYPLDYRMRTIYSTETGVESTMNDIGDIPDNYTLRAPTSDFDSWDGENENWVFDTEKQHQYYVEQATTKKTQLINEATNKIAFLQDAVEAEIATTEEQIAYTAWKKYRVLLNRINVNNALNIEWPTKPK